MKNKKVKQLSLEEIKKIELDILKQFVMFCDIKNLQYSLCGGTLLGAIRHKGFIPWDDDIDLFIPRKTYSYLCRNFNKWGKNKNLKLINYYSHGYYSTFAKIIDTRTKAVEEKRNEKIGVWIDLFIVDSMKSNKESFSNPILKEIKEIRYFGSEEYFKNKSISFINIKKYLLRAIKKIILRHKIEKFIRSNGGEHNVAYSFADQISWWEKISNINFNKCLYVEFEGSNYKAMWNWDEYLTHRYGNDYMKLPPIEKRVSHPLLVCTLKNHKNKEV